MGKIKLVDYLIKRLYELGIEKIFGLPGDYNFKIVEAVEKNKNVSWIGSANELNAGYCADGYARIKGYGALVTTFGVGELSAMNAIAGSMAENVPVIKIVGTPSLKNIKNKILLHHNLDNADYYAFEKAYSNIVETTAFLNYENAKFEIDRLLNTMTKSKKPVYLAIPEDVCYIETDDNFKSEKIKSDENTLKEAVNEIIKLVENSNKPIVLAGVLTGRFSAKKELNDFLNKTEMPSCAFIRGMDIVNSDTKNYLGVFAGSKENRLCYNYLDNSDCIISSGCVLSDINTMNFDFNFDLKNHINIMPYYTEIKGKKYENIKMADLIKELTQKLNYLSKENLQRTFKYEKSKLDNKPLNQEYLYSRLNEFLRNNDIIVTETGLVPLASMLFELPKNTNIINQTLWGSIGWATPCAEGCCFADESRRTILITGDGSHQLTAQEISTMMRNKLKPIIFVLNNGGYTVERILCDNIGFKYNDIAKWDYSKLPSVFWGECFTKKVKTNKEFNDVLNEIENIDKMCYIELMLDSLDIPKMARYIAKHPEDIK